MKTSRFFSFLEIMIALAIVLMAAGAIGWKVQGLIENRQFRGDLERLKSCIFTTQKMAVNMQADWTGILKRNGKNWTFETNCLDIPKPKSFSPLTLHLSQLSFNGKKQDSLTFTFFSSGEIWPSGSVQFYNSKTEQKVSWNLPTIFGKEEKSATKKLGPIHPDEV